MRINPWKILFVVVAVYATWTNHRSQIWNGFGLEATTLTAADAWGWSDPGSYLKTGVSLLVERELTPEFHWVANLWTLGMPTLVAGSLFFVGLDGQFLIPLLFLALCLWYQVFRLFEHVCRKLKVHPIVASCSICAFLLTPTYRSYLIGKSLIYSDGLATVIFFYCIVLTLSAARGPVTKRQPSKVTASMQYLQFIGLGLCVGILTLFRNQYLISVQVLLFSVPLCLTGLFIRMLMRKSLLVSRTSSEQNGRAFALRLVFVAVGSLIVLGPYVNWKANEIGDISWDLGGKYTLSSSSAIAVKSNWGTRESKPSFIKEGGGGTACEMNPVLCDEIHRAESEDPTPWNIYDSEPYTANEFRALMMSTFYSDPAAWTLDRIPYFIDFFSRSPINNASTGVSGFVYTVSVAILGALGLGFFILRVSKSTGNKFTGLFVFTLSLALFFGVLAPPFFAHFETRYLVPLRAVLLLFMFAFVAETFLSIISTKSRFLPKSKVLLGSRIGH